MRLYPTVGQYDRARVRRVTGLFSGPGQRVRTLFAWVIMCAIAVLSTGLWTTSARALEPIVIEKNQQQLDITNRSTRYAERGDRISIETVAGPDGVRGRVVVRASRAGSSPKWVVFALRNSTDETIDRWLTANRYTIIGSGIVNPDLDAQRVAKVTPSIGFVPQQIKDDQADIFRITLQPGQTVTYVTEVVSDRFPRLALWAPLAYEQKQRNTTLFHGIMLGLTGLLAIFLTSIFAANHKAVFPVSGLVAWTVLAYLCIDFGFWHQVFQLRPGDNALYRAAAEGAVAASIVLFLYSFLRLGYWHGWIRLLFAVWIVGQIAIVAVAVIDPVLSATLARLSLLVAGGVGSVLILYLALSGQDQALSLMPTWMLFLVWLFGASVIANGQLSGDLVVNGLVAGLVLLVVLIGFTVTQFAFGAVDNQSGAPHNQLQLRSAAIEGAGAAVWEWNSRRDEISVTPVVEEVLGLQPGDLNCRTEDWIKHLHPADREKLRLALWSLHENGGGNISMDFRVRQLDGVYRWFELEATTLKKVDQRLLRCVGLMLDVTETKRAHERLIHDAVHDNVSKLPNRELFLDRTEQALLRAREGMAPRPTVLFIDLDRFKSVNNQYGMNVGDTMLMMIARRLSKHLTPHQTLARVGGDQFAILLTTEHQPAEIGMVAERVRRSIRSPMTIAGDETFLTGSIGIAIFDGHQASAQDLLREGELAMYRAKRGGEDRIEMFSSRMRTEHDERVSIENDLKQALKRDQIRVEYQPIVRLSTEELIGFEALIRWDHPKHGALNPDDFIPIAEDSNLIAELGAAVLRRAANQTVEWHKLLPRSEDQLFVSVNMSSKQLFKAEFLNEVRSILGREIVPRGCLWLEVTESSAMENPERAAELLKTLKNAGARIALDDFGTGHSSLSYLERFPFDTIKIDKSLVLSAAGGESGSVIMKSIIALGHELGKNVVAEGVEDLEAAKAARLMGCDAAQGYYYGEPLTEREVGDLLKNLRKADKKSEKRRRLGGRIKKAKPAKVSKSSPADKPDASASTDTKEASNGVPVTGRHANGGYATETGVNGGGQNGGPVNGGGAPVNGGHVHAPNPGDPNYPVTETVPLSGGNASANGGGNGNGQGAAPLQANGNGNGGWGRSSAPMSGAQSQQPGGAGDPPKTSPLPPMRAAK